MERIKATKTSMRRLVHYMVVSEHNPNLIDQPEPPPYGEGTQFEKLRGSRTYFLSWTGHSAYLTAGFGCGLLSINSHGLETTYHIPLEELRHRFMLEKVEEKKK